MTELSIDRLPRRSFLASSLTAVAGATSLTAAHQPGRPFGISLAPWSLMRRVAGQHDAEDVDLWSYPRVARELGFDAVEHDNLHFPGELPEANTIRRMRKACDAEGLTSTLILCGALGDIADEDASSRRRFIDKYRAWAEAATRLGCSAIRVVCADRKTELSFDEKRRHAVDGIRTLALHTEKLGIDLLIENHGGYSSDPRWLTRVIQEVDQPNCGVLADFTHWSVEREPERNVIDPYEGMKLLAPHTRSVSAHAYNYDETGNETQWDYRRFMQILTEGGFRGYVAIEYFGKQLSRMDGTRKARLLLQRVRRELS